MPSLLAASFKLSLFPPNGFDSSLVTPILIGLLILFLLNETFGWVFTGLVVPGYLAAVFVIQPVTGAVMGVEALLAYLMARVLCDWPSALGIWSRFFGRERFFIVILSSITVRILLEAKVLPWLTVTAPRFGWETGSIADHLYSIGLLVVPLCGNMLWKLGAVRGLPQVVLPTFGVWAVLTYVLVPFTNLSLSSFELSYEDMALGFLNAPRAYIMLIAGAWAGAHANVRWGWDSSGIMIMALLSLSWLTPEKLLVTVLEVTLLAPAVVLITNLKFLRTRNLEGGRRIALVFGAAYLAKWIGSAVAWKLAPELRITDMFGFGYLMTSLLALKVVGKGWGVIMLPALQTSFFVAVLTTVLGFGMAVTSGPGLPERSGEASVADAEETSNAPAALHRLSGRVIRTPVNLERRQINAWLRGALDTLSDAPQQREPRLKQRWGLERVYVRDPDLGVELSILREGGGADELLGRGSLAVRRRATCPVLLSVEHPVKERGLLTGTTALFLDLGAKALFVPGSDPLLPGAAAPEPIIARAALRESRISVRRGREGNRLLVRKALPNCLNIGLMREHLGELDIELDSSVSDTMVLELSSEGIAALGRRARELAGYEPEPVRPIRGPDELPIRIATGREQRPSAVTGSSWDELRYLDHEVLGLLLRDTRRAAEPEAVAALDFAARHVAYRLSSFETAAGQRYLLLHEAENAQHGRGALLLRPGAKHPLFLALPELPESRGQLRQALNLTEGLDAAALVIGGRPPDDTLDDSGRHARSLLARIHRVAFSGGIDERPATGLQLRRLATDRGIEEHAVLALGRTYTTDPDLAQERVRSRLNALGLGPTPVAGGAEFTDLSGSRLPMMALARRYRDRNYAVLWTSVQSRRRFEPGWQASVMHAARETGVPFREIELDRWWSENMGDITEAPPAPDDGTLGEAVAMFRKYRSTGNLRGFRRFLDHCKRGRLAPRMLFDPGSGILLLEITDRNRRVVLLPAALGFEVSTEGTDPIGSLRCGMVLGYGSATGSTE